MSARRKATTAFVLALASLLLSGVAAYLSTIRLVQNQLWVTHSREVQVAIGDVTAVVGRAARARGIYVSEENAGSLPEFNAARDQVPQALQNVSNLTKDNPDQQVLASQLADVVNQRVSFLQQSMDLKTQHPSDTHGQAEINLQSAALPAKTAEISQRMQDEEQQILNGRESRSRRLLISTVALLVFTFVLALILFSAEFALLSVELTAREEAEQASRALSARIMQVQDEERKKMARELHDSLGQYLAGTKMMLDMMAAENPQDTRYAQCANLLDQSIAETRTLSYLLHPPGLDEVGFSSAATWFIEGFGQRSGIQVTCEIPDTAKRLRPELELALFRVLQESLTNIHKHSKSRSAAVKLRLLADRGILTISDDGVGIPPSTLELFNNYGTSGVGLAGMRDRIAEVGGKFEVTPGRTGTTISVTVPLQATQTTSVTQTLETHTVRT